MEIRVIKDYLKARAIMKEWESRFQSVDKVLDTPTDELQALNDRLSKLNTEWIPKHGNGEQGS